MIFFAGNDGSIISSFPSPVYQGGANANNIYLVAPFAKNLEVTVAFKLPNGVYTERKPMTKTGEISGVINKETGKPYSGWQYSMPNEITAYYGTVTAQFYFYGAETGKILASSSTSFVVGKGVPEIPPAEPSEDVYDIILSNITALREQLENGTYAARAIYAYNSEYNYGAGELVFYPDRGEHGTFLKSLVVDNDNAPYVNGALKSEYWEEIVDFNILNSLYTLKEDVETSATAAAASAAESAGSAVQAGESATAAQASEQVAKQYSENAESKAAEAENWADVAKHYAQFGLKLNTDYTSVNQLPVPGNAQNIYLIPNGASGNNGYDEYVWIESKSAYEKLGTTEIDLTDYATKAQVANEVTSRESADTALGVRIDGTETAIATLQRDKASVMSLNSETSARESADTALGARIDGNDTDIAALQSGKVSKSGDTMTGPLNLPQGQQARGYKDTGVTFEYSNKNPSGFYSSVFARYDKCFVCGEGGDKAIFQYDYSNGWNTKVSNNGIEELSVLWMDKNGHLLDNGSRVSLREDRETEQKYAKYINTTPGSSYTKIATVKAEEPSLLTVYGMETSEMGGIIISNEPSLRGGTEWSHTPNADELARAEGEQGYWGKQYLCCTVLIAKGATVYVWGRYITNLYYTLQPVFKKEG